MKKTCLNPYKYFRSGRWYLYPCQKCPTCRDLVRMQMAARLLLEKSIHPERSIFFLALTYEDSFLPSKGFDRSHIDGFLGSLRTRARRQLGTTIRYLLVSEYGDLDKRQHYHFVCMTSRRFEYHAPIVELPGGYKVYSNEFVQLVRDCWPYGFVDDGGTPTAAAIMYTTGYALKEDEFSNDHEDELSELWRWTHHKYSETASTPKHLLKLKPLIPFRRFSLRPGLGLDEDTVEFVYKYMYNDGINFRFSIDLGQGFIVPIPGIYLDKFAVYHDGDATFSELCKEIRKDAFDNDMQSDLYEAYERSGGSDDLSRAVRAARMKKRLDTKINNLLSQTSNIYRHEI